MKPTQELLHELASLAKPENFTCLKCLAPPKVACLSDDPPHIERIHNMTVPIIFVAEMFVQLQQRDEELEKTQKQLDSARKYIRLFMYEDD